MDILTLDPYVLHGLEHHSACSLGTSTKVYLSYMSMLPTIFPGIPDSPAMAPQDVARLHVLVLSNIDEKSGHIVSSDRPPLPPERPPPPLPEFLSL